MKTGKNVFLAIFLNGVKFSINSCVFVVCVSRRPAERRPITGFITGYSFFTVMVSRLAHSHTHTHIYIYACIVRVSFARSASCLILSDT